ncbi:cell wall-binding repeat-containing protein [Sutcliffiella horikoshii]|uniref:cell wall-binding repeat-containing protein n=1 Tax=Sutcliffiella horikoshii TaxID=79883 RepID=UPI003CED3A62
MSGTNRYLTSVEVAETFYPESVAVGVASGKMFPDALSGSNFSSMNNMQNSISKWASDDKSYRLFKRSEGRALLHLWRDKVSKCKYSKIVL